MEGQSSLINKDLFIKKISDNQKAVHLYKIHVLNQVD